MKNNNLRSYKFWYRILLILGLISILDGGTRSIVEKNFNLSDIGYVSLGISYFFGYVLGAEIAGFIAVLTSLIFSFGIVYLLFAYFLNSKIKELENPSLENKKKFKRAQIITWIIGVMLLFLLVYIFSVIIPG
ncbi:MAG: hypothetical protein WAP74_00145 [Patescibacteria group bacterium]